MPGIRLRHPSLRGVMFTLIHFGRPLEVPYLCSGVCNAWHHHKTYHLDLDQNGERVVSETVLERLTEADIAPLQVIGREADPPPLLVGGPAVHHHVVRRED